jgi:phosphomannomutase
MDLKKLQNGSDIRGIALDGIVNEPVNLTPEVVNLLGKAFGKWLEMKGFKKPSVAVGMDSRISGPGLIAEFCGGLASRGITVYDCGLASTPAMFMATISETINADGAVMLTASHLPFNRNGLKFFTKNGGLSKDDITSILNIAGSMPQGCGSSGAESGIDGGKPGTISKVDLMSEYSSSLVNYIRKAVNDTDNYDRPLEGFKIIVDAGNGAGGFFAGKVLEPLGADTRGSQFLEPDGLFPNHIPNPEDEEAMTSLCSAVKKEKADLGIIFDTDVDRSAIADSKGNPVNRNRLIALISATVLNEHPGSIIVTDSITSDGLTGFIENELKGVHFRFKRGYKNIIDKAQRLNDEGMECHLAIETSGHAALKENYFLDDGAFLVAKLLARMANLKKKNAGLLDLIKNLPEPAESREFRLTIHASDFAACGMQVIEKLREWAAAQEGMTIQEPNYEGLRVRCSGEDENGWFLIRLSLHDPVLPLNVESNVEGGVSKITGRLKKILSSFSEVNCPF